MNESKYALLLQRAKDGEFDSMMIAFPCTTISIARFFDATDSRGDRGPEPIRDKQHPDGLPEDRLSPAQIKELRASNRLLDRAIDLAIAARLSPRKTTIVFENPADRTVSGTPHYMEDIPHGSPTVASSYTTTHQATRRSPSAYTLTISKSFTLPSWTPTGMQLTKIVITLNSCCSFAKIGI